MSWSDFSPLTRGFVIVAGLLLVGLLLFRSCAGGDADAPPPPRGPAAQ